MKKLMIAATAALCATVGFSLESANIVGYKTFNLNAEYTLIGLCFEDVAGGAMDINTAIPYAEGMTKAFSLANADNVQVLGADGGYTTYFLSNGQYGKASAPSYKAELDGKWVKTAGVECTDKVPSGAAFWYVSRTAKTTPHTITVAGGVVASAATEPVTCIATYTLFGNPYACEVPLNGNVIVTGGTSALALANADNIQVMGADGGYTTYFLSNGQYGKASAPSYKEELDGTWVKTAGVACTDTIPVGGAFWYVSQSKSNTVTIKNPIAE